ncbi:MAG: acyltransferase [Balneolales bacterium]
MIILKLAVLIFQLKDTVAQTTLPQFANKPKNLQFRLPRVIGNPERIYIGDDVKLGPGCMIKVSTKYPGSWMRHPDGNHVSQTFNPKLVIGNNVTATSNLHLATTNYIKIGDHVMFASNVFMADCSHGYDHAEIPYKYQGLTNIAPIIIKNGVWIGQNVVILPGVTIGENVIIGANSVVRTNIPDKCIAVGNPARVIKKWNGDTGTWQKVKKKRLMDV